MTSPTACLIIIGNEILSGRTQDKNLAHVATELNSVGVHLREVRVIPDVEQVIIDTVNECRAKYSYLFTTGGIGPTHDDITSLSIAKAFGVKLIRHLQAERILRAHYNAADINEARLKMADMPEGATLIPNPVSAAPGFQIANVFVMAGLPRIMQAMLAHIKPTLTPGEPVLSRTLSLFVTEGTLAKGLEAIQHQNPDVEIGSYPFIRQGKLGTSLVMRSTDAKRLETTAQALLRFLIQYDQDILEDEIPAG